MKNLTPPKAGPRFSGTRRYYHRAGSNNERSWDEWVGDPDSKSHGGKNRLKITGIVVAALALLAIAAGLFTELI